jgi:hypothetical protein
MANQRFAAEQQNPTPERVVDIDRLADYLAGLLVWRDALPIRGVEQVGKDIRQIAEGGRFLEGDGEGRGEGGRRCAAWHGT